MLMPQVMGVLRGRQLTRFSASLFKRFLCSSRDNLNLNLSSEHLGAFVHLPYSYAFGRSSKHLLNTTVDALLLDQASKNASKLAVISHHEGLKKTFSELNSDVNRVAALLQQLNVKRGDVVGLWSCNSYLWVSVQYACARVGAIVCTLNPAYKIRELDYTLKKARIKVLVLPGKGSKQTIANNHFDLLNDPQIVNSITAKDSALRDIVVMDGESDGNIGNINVHHFEEALGNVEPAQVASAAKPDDGCFIMFTSGTTGKPKGATLSHFTVTNNAFLAGQNLQFDTNSVLCMPLPLFHCFAAVLGSVLMSTTSSTLVLTGYKFDSKSVVDSLVNYKCTQIFGTPTMIIDIMNYVEQHNIQMPSLKGVLMGGAATPVEVANRVTKTIPSATDVRIGYGATELGPCTSGSMKEDSIERRMETVGRPLDFVELKVIDPKTEELLKIGEQGELLARGHNVMMGYWDEEEKTKESMTSNWYKTGDLATMDSFGYIKIVGRTKELIIRGGENIYPREVEELLHTHPAVLDAYVIGVPDERLGEDLCAWIKLRNPSEKLTPEDIKKFCKNKITYFKIPNYVLFVDEFPLTATGKAQKFIMREKSCKILGLKEL